MTWQFFAVCPVPHEILGFSCQPTDWVSCLLVSFWIGWLMHSFTTRRA